jgi:hypothetical protein
LIGSHGLWKLGEAPRGSGGGVRRRIFVGWQRNHDVVFAVVDPDLPTQFGELSGSFGDLIWAVDTEWKVALIPSRAP